MKRLSVIAVAFTVVGVALGACTVREERVVQPAPAPTQTVVTPVPPGSVVYTRPAEPTTTTTTVYPGR